MNTQEITVVTGATRGIGVEIVSALARAGRTVFLGARDPERGHELASTIPGDVRVLELDVTNPSTIQAAVATVGGVAQRLDVLVNNAAINTDLNDDGVLPLASVSSDDLRRTLETNVVGLAAVTNALLPLLRNGHNPRIVNLSSGIASLTLMADPTSRAAQRRLLAYSTSKAAVNALTLLYANELRADGIRVNAVDPGFVATDMNNHQGTLSTMEGAVPAVSAALASEADGITGTFTGQGREVVPW
jgi:NAD(P)-dependent dehydrogenase (short-subunit alcohol dehydrogenase family)